MKEKIIPFKGVNEGGFVIFLLGNLAYFCGFLFGGLGGF
jgi:hypothetical protein